MYTISKIYVTTKELIHYKLMMRCVMNTKACEYIVAIAEKKNLSAAAASLGISQPTLSSFLSNTERNLKQTLFTRQKKICPDPGWTDLSGSLPGNNPGKEPDLPVHAFFKQPVHRPFYGRRYPAPGEHCIQQGLRPILSPLSEYLY